ncbi:MAG: type II toxin-antitoxin system VapC family toxin [Acidobacteria bacterium]|nr:type II toxin-antitoxin system VapC family toxin [Acidobacteriota bacterium]
MRILLDTHVLIWYLEGNQGLSRTNRQKIVDPDNEIFFSLAGFWEIAIKAGTNKLKISRSLSEILQQLSAQSIQVLNIQPGHILQLATLPFHHRDPFDRMMIAQAQVEFLPVLTHDSAFADYGIKLI